ncbi:MAG: PKD domain-containing protein [Panacagrimonas sp.]
MNPFQMRTITHSLAALFVLSGIALASNTHAAERPPLPLLRLAGELRGEAAVQGLGANLPAVAAHYRMTQDRLAGILRRDRTSRVDERGRLFYVEPAADEGATSSAFTVSEAAPYNLSQTFTLASKPGSARVLYLDFTGHAVSGTSWNGGAAIQAQAYDTDGVPGTFSDAEREAIQKIWQRVAEDYAPFDVNVTTADPGADAIRRSSSSDTNYGSRVVITRNTFYNCSCGGVAYVGTFDYSGSNPDYYQPAWVFFNALSNGNEKSVAEAVTHEAGHNLGLSHDGRTSPAEGYYAGHGSGDTAWAPIMGAGYTRNLTQWNKGEYLSANNLEDDLSIIQQNGVQLRADDAGNTTAAATSLGGAASNGSVTIDRPGLIGQRGDVDVYSFVAGAGTVRIDVAPAVLGPNLDIEARLLDGGGNTLAVSNPADSLGASLNVSVSGGGYYLRIDGLGRGDTASGYSDYGSIGQYRVTGSFVDTGAAGPVAAFTVTPASGTAPLPVSFDGSLSSDADGYIASHAWSFGDGTSATGITASRTYASAGTYTATLTVTDNQGQTARQTKTITVTSGLPVVYVRTITVSATALAFGYQCTASVAVRNASNVSISGANVSGTWSGTAKGTASAVTNASGVAMVRSPWAYQRGTCTFTVGNISAAGSTYDAARNLVSSGSRTY